MTKKAAIFFLVLFFVSAIYFFLPWPGFRDSSTVDKMPAETPVDLIADKQNNGTKCDDGAFYIKQEMVDDVKSEIIDDRCNDLQIAIARASSAGNVSEIRELLKKGSSVIAPAVNHGEITLPIVAAVKNGQTEAVKLLLDNGGDVNTEYNCCASSKSLLMIAVQRKDVATVKLLLERGADVSYQDRYEGFNVFDLIREANSAEINALLSTGCEVSVAERFRCRVEKLKGLF